MVGSFFSRTLGFAASGDMEHSSCVLSCAPEPRAQPFLHPIFILRSSLTVLGENRSKYLGVCKKIGDPNIAPKIEGSLLRIRTPK